MLKLWLSGTLPMEVPFTEVWSGQHLRIAGERRKRRGQGRGWGLSSSLGPCCIGIGNRNRSEKADFCIKTALWNNRFVINRGKAPNGDLFLPPVVAAILIVNLGQGHSYVGKWHWLHIILYQPSYCNFEPICPWKKPKIYWKVKRNLKIVKDQNLSSTIRQLVEFQESRQG